MECVHCGTGCFNRVIVDLAASAQRGGLCADCEAAEYGRVLEEPLRRRSDGCLLCAAEGAFALPVLDCLIEHDRGEELEYALDEATPLLCRDHASALLPAVAVDAGAQVH